MKTLICSHVVSGQVRGDKRMRSTESFALGWQTEEGGVVQSGVVYNMCFSASLVFC